MRLHGLRLETLWAGNLQKAHPDAWCAQGLNRLRCPVQSLPFYLLLTPKLLTRDHLEGRRKEEGGRRSHTCSNLQVQIYFGFSSFSLFLFFYESGASFLYLIYFLFLPFFFSIGSFLLSFCFRNMCYFSLLLSFFLLLFLLFILAWQLGMLFIAKLHAFALNCVLGFYWLALQLCTKVDGGIENLIQI